MLSTPLEVLHIPANVRYTSKSSIHFTLAESNAESLDKYLVTSSLSYSTSVEISVKYLLIKLTSQIFDNIYPVTFD